MHKCIHSFWQYCLICCNIARIPAILICMRNPVLPQCCSKPQHCRNTGRNCCCNIAATLLQYCRNIVAIYCQKVCISVYLFITNQVCISGKLNSKIKINGVVTQFGNMFCSWFHPVCMDENLRDEIERINTAALDSTRSKKI